MKLRRFISIFLCFCLIITVFPSCGKITGLGEGSTVVSDGTDDVTDDTASNNGASEDTALSADESGKSDNTGEVTLSDTSGTSTSDSSGNDSGSSSSSDSGTSTGASESSTGGSSTSGSSSSGTSGSSTSGSSGSGSSTGGTDAGASSGSGTGTSTDSDTGTSGDDAGTSSDTGSGTTTVASMVDYLGVTHYITEVSDFSKTSIRWDEDYWYWFIEELAYTRCLYYISLAEEYAQSLGMLLVTDFSNFEEEYPYPEYTIRLWETPASTPATITQEKKGYILENLYERILYYYNEGYTYCNFKLRTDGDCFGGLLEYSNINYSYCGGILGTFGK